MEPLYYSRPMLKKCDTTIVNKTPDGHGIFLEQTVFYPEGGGQPGDHGHLIVDGTQWIVSDTQKRDDGTILHVLRNPIPDKTLPGTSVTAVLDWDHRFDYMQQHTGQHILSGALSRVASAATVSVHQGLETTTIEVDVSDLSQDQINQVDDEANRIIDEERAIRSFWVDHTSLEEYQLRRPTSRTGRIRLVEILDFDLVACGGVHLPHTGLVSSVQCVGTETIRGRLRLAYKIGRRVRSDYRIKHRATTEAAVLVSSHPSELPTRVQDAIEEIQELHRVVRKRAERLAELIITEERGTAKPELLILEKEDDDVFKALAETAAVAPGRRLLLMNATGSTLQWAIVIGTDFSVPAGPLRKEVLEPFGAKGGGKSPLWRGILPECDTAGREAFADAFVQFCRDGIVRTNR